MCVAHADRFQRKSGEDSCSECDAGYFADEEGTVSAKDTTRRCRRLAYPTRMDEAIQSSGPRKAAALGSDARFKRHIV